VKRIPACILIFFICDLALALVYLLNWELRQPFATITLLVDLNGEANLPTWYSSIQLFAVATLLAIFAFGEFDKKNIHTWTLLVWPFVFLALSLDEVAQIHEYVGYKSDILLPGRTRDNSVFHETGIWMFLVGLPFLFLMLSLVFSLKKYLGGSWRISNVFLAAVIVYVGSAAGADAIENFIPPNGSERILQVCFEELGEMIGATLFLLGAYKLLYSHGFSLHIRKTQVAVHKVEQQVGTIAA
jgi:hypothetical protein